MPSRASKPNRDRRAQALALAAAAALALAAAAGAARAQDGTVYVGGTGQADNRSVIVNDDALGGGTAPVDTRRDDSVSTPDRGSMFGQMVEGPSGVMLRFPPKDAPRSHLTVQMPDDDGAATARATQPTPQRKPEQRQPGSRTAEALEQQPAEPRTPPTEVAGAKQDTQAGDAAPQRTAETDTTAPDVPPPPEAQGATTARRETESAASGEQARSAEPTAEPEQTRTAETQAEPSEPGPSQQTTAAAEPAAASESEQTRTAETEATGEDAGQQQAALTEGAAEGGIPDRVRLTFAGGSADLGGDASDKLAQLAERLQDNPQTRIQLMAYAKSEDGSESRARRLSLSRALAVRSYLIDQGIRSTRMDVRALGQNADQGPLDRVDIVPARR